MNASKVIEDGKYRTTTPSDFLSLICSMGNGFSGIEKEKGGISAHPSREVVPEKLLSNKMVEFFERMWLIFNSK